jgi:DNA-binding response OmpR family regulator
MKILVADDDEVVRTFVQRVAEHAGHEVTVAENGREALEAAQRIDPDILITDWRMPELDGYGLVEALRALPRHAGLPVICLTSVSEREDVIRMIESGISDYVLKPVRPGDLATRLQNVSRREQFWKAERRGEVTTAG